ncbi:MAG: histidinol-phosphatase [Oscillibacter sp.]|nr:histidinol-phosphatase [Oscillibacter sp.]
MIKTDLHTHTTFCDGKNTPAEMARAAYALGMDCLGFSGHGYAPYDTDACMTREGAREYRAAVAALKAEYAGKMRILCGVEQDFWSEESTAEYDYVIGSVHYIKCGAEYVCVDDSPERLCAGVERHFGGDFYACAEAYFDTVARVAEKTRCDIIGHFDLISKFNEKAHLFDEAHPRYAAAWQRAAERLLPYGKPFEINTGAMTRAWRTSPYPSAEMIDYLRERGARFLLSSDSHRAETLLYGFEPYEKILGDRLIRNTEEFL